MGANHKPQKPLYIRPQTCTIFVQIHKYCTTINYILDEHIKLIYQTHCFRGNMASGMMIAEKIC